MRSTLKFFLSFLLVVATCPAVRAQGVRVTFQPVGPDVIAKKIQLQPASTEDRFQAMRKLFAAAGCGTRTFDQPVPNSIATLGCSTRGTSDAEILVLAPTDYNVKTEEDSALRWGDLVMLPTLAETLGSVLARHRFTFLAIGGTKDGEEGAAEYLKKLPSEERKKIDAVIALDHLGRALPIYDSPNIPYQSQDTTTGRSGRARYTQTQAGSADAKPLPLVQSIVMSADALHMPMPTRIEGTKTNLTKPFEREKIQAITFSSPETVIIRTIPNMGHEYPIRETRKKFDANAYNQTYLFFCAYLLYLDQTLGKALPAPSEKIAEETLAASAAENKPTTPAATPSSEGNASSTPAATTVVAEASIPPVPPVAQPPASSPQPNGEIPVFQSTTRLVQLDVVVTDKSGNPILNLRKEDFTVLQDSRPESVRVFEPHTGNDAADAEAQPPADAAHPLKTYSNMPAGNTSQARTILLFDEWNTPLLDQQIARNQLKKVAQQLPKGQPVSLFVLTDHLAMVQPFTTDPQQILAAIQHLGTLPSSGLTTEAERQHDVGQMAYAQQQLLGTQAGAPGAGTAGALHAQAYKDMESYRVDQRNLFTIDAFASIARSVAGYPGRKNLIWLSGSFPVVLMADASTDTNASRLSEWKNSGSYLSLLGRTSALLASARIAVYPVDIRGMQTRGVEITTSGSESVAFANSSDAYANLLSQQTYTAASERQTMEDVAKETGGRAFINTNDFAHAITRAMQDGANYYTLAYSPDTKDDRATFHRIQVKLNRPDVQLSYRQGYYSQPETASAQNGLAALRGALQPGMPPATMLIFQASVNHPEKDPRTLDINYILNASNVTLADGPNGSKHLVLDFIAVAFDKENKEVAHASDTLDGNLPAATVEGTLRQGIPAVQELALKPGVYNIRVGVQDRASQRMGTLEMPVTIQ
jgi:VWFA-related protein